MPIEIHPLTRSEVGRFLNSLKTDRLKPLYLLALDTGMRQGELFALHCRDVDTSTAKVSVLHTLERRGGILRRKETKNRSSRRVLRIDSITLEALVPLLQAEPEAPLFRDQKGGYLRHSNVTRRSFKPACRRAGLPPGVRFHDLRHTAATDWLCHGISIKKVAQRLEHADVMTTLRTYGHVLPDDDDKVITCIHQLLSASDNASSNYT